MKNIITLCVLVVLLSSATCKEPKNSVQNCYKGRLEVKGLCMNYTIKLLEGRMDTVLYQRRWTNETTGTTHENVFRLASVCSFPANIEEGQEFYFTIPATPPAEKCNVCMAYFPTPDKSVFIKVVDAPCK